MTNTVYHKDVVLLQGTLKSLPTKWDGKQAILKLKDIDYQWRQMEWMAWYFEALCREALPPAGFAIPGKKYGRVEFDSFYSINWDMKVSAIKSDSHRVILNDQKAVDASLESYGCHGIILALVDVEYNDENRSFQKRHSQLKGGLSDYEKQRIERGATSRYRKTSVDMQQILLPVINRHNKQYLDIHKQGRNADGAPRNLKYMLDIEKSHHFEVGIIDF